MIKQNTMSIISFWSMNCYTFWVNCSPLRMWMWTALQRWGARACNETRKDTTHQISWPLIRHKWATIKTLKDWQKNKTAQNTGAIKLVGCLMSHAKTETSQVGALIWREWLFLKSYRRPMGSRTANFISLPNIWLICKMREMSILAYNTIRHIRIIRICW